MATKKTTRKPARAKATKKMSVRSTRKAPAVGKGALSLGGNMLPGGPSGPPDPIGIE